MRKPQFLCIDDDPNLAALCEAIQLQGHLAIKSEPPPHTWEAAVEELTERLTGKALDGLLLDFRLDEFSTQNDKTKVRYTAESLVNELRRRSVEGNDRSYPIILWSTAANLAWYFSINPSYTGLYDGIWRKETVLQESKQHATRLINLAEGYTRLRLAAKKKQALKTVLNCDSAALVDLEQAFTSQIKQAPYAFNYATFIINRVLAFNGILIDSDTLSALLGIKEHQKAESILLRLPSRKKLIYSGVFCEAYRRYWYDSLLTDLNKLCPKGYWLHLDATSRVSILKKALGVRNINPVPPIHETYRTDYDTICSYSRRPLARRNGYKLYSKLLDSWIQPQYIAGTTYRALTKAESAKTRLDVGEAERFKADFTSSKT